MSEINENNIENGEDTSIDDELNRIMELIYKHKEENKQKQDEEHNDNENIQNDDMEDYLIDDLYEDWEELEKLEELEEAKHIKIEYETASECMKLYYNGAFRKRDLVYSRGISQYINLDINKVQDELKYIEQIEDQEIKAHLLNQLNIYFNENHYETKFMSEDMFNYFQKLYQDKINDDSISFCNKYLYFYMYFFNEYRVKVLNVEVNARKEMVLKLKTQRENDEDLKASEQDFKDEKIEEISLKREEELKKQLEVIYGLIEKFKELNNLANKQEYNKIFDLTPQYTYDSFIKGNVIKDIYYSFSNCLPYLDSKRVYELLKKLYERNHEIGQKIKGIFLQDDVLDNVEFDVIEYFNRYGEYLNLDSIVDRFTEPILQAFKIIYNKYKQYITFPEEFASNIFDVLYQLNDEEIESIINNEKNADLVIHLARSNGQRFYFKMIENSNITNRLEVFREKMKSKARTIIHTGYANVENALNAIGIRFFNLTYDEMDKIVHKYSSDLNYLLQKYSDRKQKNGLSEEENKEYTSLKILRNISEIMKITDITALIKIFDETDQDPDYEETSYLLTSILEENLNKAYARDLNENTYKPDVKDEIGEIDGIKIYEPTEFNMFVHVIGAFREFSIVDKNDLTQSSKDLWNKSGDIENHILCTSYISNYNLCYARRANNKEFKVILGFNRINNSSVVAASSTDIGIATSIIKSNISYILPVFRNHKNLVKKCIHGHNEVDVERRIVDEKNSNIEPDFVVCINEIDEISRKVAKDFNIPIIYINKEQIAQIESQKLNDTINQFKSNKEPELLEEIITLFYCSKTSYFIGEDFEKISKKYFSTETMEQNLNEIVYIINNEYLNGERQLAERCFVALADAIENELEIFEEEHFDPENQLFEKRFNICEIKAKIDDYITKYKISKVENRAKITMIKETNSLLYKNVLKENKTDGTEKGEER